MDDTSDRFFVLTGGPGSGKTTLIDALGRAGYGQDDERKQDFAEAVRTCDAIVRAYGQYGYEIVELPRVSVELRVRFILENLAHHSSC